MFLSLTLLTIAAIAAIVCPIVCIPSRAYKMRFRVRLFLINGDPSGGDDIPTGDETTVFTVGSYEQIQEPVTTGYTSVIITSLSRAVAAIQSINNRIQSSLLTNARFEVYGKPIGTPEAGAVDIPAALQAEKRYIVGDTPQPALLVALRLANRKPVDPTTQNSGIFVPEDDTPETGEGFTGSGA